MENIQAPLLKILSEVKLLIVVKNKDTVLRKFIFKQHTVDNRRLRKRWRARGGLTFMQFLPRTFAVVTFMFGKLQS